MLKWIETTGRSEEDAIAAALFQLGMDRDDVSVEVIERAKSGFLGFGGNPAKVRVSYEVPDEEQTAPAAAEETVQEAAAPAAEEQEPAPAPQREDANRLLPGDEVLIAAEEPAPVQGDDGKAEQIRTFLTGLMEHLHVQAVPEITLTPEGSYKVVLQGQGLGAIIGRRGETLDAIQQLTSYSVNHGQQGGQIPEECDPGAHERLRAPCDPHRTPGSPQRDHLLHRDRAQPPHGRGLCPRTEKVETHRRGGNEIPPRLLTPERRPVMPTPLYDALRGYAAKAPLRFHMPGHKGAFLPCPELAPLARLDVTEIPSTGNLYEDLSPIREAQALWARRMGAEYCQFLTGGSTMGIHTALTLCCPPGSRVLVDRSCHRSTFHALALLDLDPIFLPRPWLAEEGVAGPFSPLDVKKMLDQDPTIKTVCITSPTYCGLLSDIPAIAGVVHAHGGKLVVDGAHGAHLQFLGMDAYRGADAVVVSAHKTLPAMGQAALLFTNGIDPGQVRRTAAIYGTSSPSYPILASLDTAREWLEGPGAGEYGRVARRTAALRCRFPSLCPPLPLDPTRFTLKVKNGPAFTGQLESRCNIWPEMEDGGHVVFILTACDGEEALDRLESVLEGMEEQMGDSAPLPPPPLPERVLSPRQAQFAPAEVLPLERTEGRVCTCQLAPYPPGVPVVAPGERIGKKELAYFRQIGYNNREVTVAAMP